MTIAVLIDPNDGNRLIMITEDPNDLASAKAAGFVQLVCDFSQFKTWMATGSQGAGVSTPMQLLGVNKVIVPIPAPHPASGGVVSGGTTSA